MLKEDRYSLKDTTFVVIIGLLLAFTLNVKGVYNWAQRLPHGENRESLLALLRPINNFYLAVGLSAPKQFISDWFNSSRVIVKPDTSEPIEKSSLPLVGPPTPASFQRNHPGSAQNVSNNILIMGDSMMVGALGKVLVTELEKTPFKPYRRARISTGLARPDYFNWHNEVIDVYKDREFRKAFVMLGGNDTQDIKIGDQRVSLFTRQWAKVYSKRVRKLVDYMCQTTPEIVWLGSPPMRSKTYNRKIQFVNKVLAASLKDYKCATFFPTGPIFSDKSGQYASYQKVFGEFKKVRMKDGIHLTRSGGELLAQHLFDKVKLGD